MTNANDPISGTKIVQETTWEPPGGVGTYDKEIPSALTKREYFASVIYAALLANPTPYSDSARHAVLHADALINALNEPICKECKCSLSDGHYDAEHDICSIAERASQ